MVNLKLLGETQRQTWEMDIRDGKMKRNIGSLGRRKRGDLG